MLSQFCVRSENEKQQTEKTERAMLSQFCVRSENEKQAKTEKTERAMLSQFCVRSENEKQQSEKRARGPCCRSFVFVQKMRSNKLKRPRGHAVAVLCSF